MTHEPGPADAEPGGRRSPLSPVQRGMWFLTQMDGEPAYMFQAWLRLRGRLDRRALSWALDEIIRRHSALRTSFLMVQGTPFQQVHPSAPAVLEHRCLVGLDPEEQARRLDEAAGEVVSQPFDPFVLPLIRWTLFELAEDDHRLLHAEHHLIHDGWSFAVFLEELTCLYLAAVSGAEPDLDPPSQQYWEYAEQQVAEPEALVQEGLRYWQAQLAGVPGTIALPPDRSRPAVQRFAGSTHDFVLDPELAARARQAAASLHSTLFSVMFAAFVVLLQRYSGESDLAVGSGFANRSDPDAERMIGMLVSTVVLRVRLDDDPTLGELLERVQDVVYEAIDHQDTPFSEVVRVLHVDRSLAANPVTPVLFSFHDAPLARVDDDTLTIDVREGVNVGAAKVDLDVVAITSTRRRILGPALDEPDSIRMVWDFSTDVFEPGTIRRMAGHYVHLLDELCRASPATRVSELALAGPAPAAPGGIQAPRATVVELFEARVDRGPERPAVVDGADVCSYAQLNARANRLAHSLRRRGVGPESRVGIRLERSVDLVVAVLGVLKAGAAYVPLDAMLPDSRLRWIAEDARLAAVVGTGDHGTWPVSAPGEDDGNPGVPIHERSLAHILYTSGSTGTPRGVGIEHRSLANFVEATADDFQVTEADRIPQLAAFAFDTHAEEIFVALCRGATLVTHIEPTDPAELLRLAEAAGVTVLDLPTAYWAEVVRALGTGGGLPPAVRLVAIGGEAATEDATAAWCRLTDGSVRLRNGYGPTEATGVATATDITAEDGRAGRAPPIGAPMANVRAHVVDGELRPVPVGVPGELLIGGLAPARGYVDRPAWTAERFLPDPFAAAPGSRVYRTGDRARWRDDGRLEFLGRADDQIKIRGFRIEPAEVEGVLARLPFVEEAVVTVRGEGRDRRLVAYLVGWDGRTPPTSEVRAQVHALLPNYMVPQAFVPLDHRPTTPTGKLDARALPDPAPPAPEAPTAPATPHELELLGIWKEVLAMDDIGVTDNFFDLGGDSFRSMVVMAMARERGLTVELRHLFEHQTVRGLLAAISQDGA